LEDRIVRIFVASMYLNWLNRAPMLFSVQISDGRRDCLNHGVSEGALTQSETGAGATLDPAKPWELLQQGYKRLRSGEGALARSILERAKQNWPLMPEFRLFEANLVEAEGDAVAANALYREAATALAAEVDRAPTASRAIALGQARLKCGDLDGVESALAVARRHEANALGLLRLERALAFAQKDFPAMRQAAESIVASQGELTTYDYVALAIACRDLGDFDAAAEAAAQARDLEPNHLEAARISAWVALRRGDVENAIASHRFLAELAPGNSRLAFQLIRLLVLTGRVAEAGQELNRVLLKWPDDPALRAFALVTGYRSVDELPEHDEPHAGNRIDWAREQQIRQLARMAPADDALRRPLIVEDKTRDVIVGPSSRSDMAVLVFTALTDSLSIPISIFDRYLAALGVTAIYLKDFQRLFYLNGIASLGASSASTVESLRALCGRVNARRICTIGASAGGFAAMKYGVELDVERSLNFAAETHDPGSGLSKVEQGVALIRRRVANQAPAVQLDLRPLLTSKRASTEIYLYYPADAPREKEQALHLSGVNGVQLRPVAGCGDHELLRWMALREDLTSFLRVNLAV
jgi:tetratricopeptide (TPR) repeat protein